MSQLLPPQLAGPSGPVPGGLMTPTPGDEGQQAPSDGGLSALQDVIEDFPALLAALHDPNDVNAAAQCLAKLTSIQARIMGASGPAA